MQSILRQPGGLARKRPDWRDEAGLGALIGVRTGRAGLRLRRYLHLNVYRIRERFAIYNGHPGRVRRFTSEEGSNHAGCGRRFGEAVGFGGHS